jgi:hypothetical protein
VFARVPFSGPKRLRFWLMRHAYACALTNACQWVLVVPSPCRPRAVLGRRRVMKLRRASAFVTPLRASRWQCARALYTRFVVMTLQLSRFDCKSLTTVSYSCFESARVSFPRACARSRSSARFPRGSPTRHHDRDVPFRRAVHMCTCTHVCTRTHASALRVRRHARGRARFASANWRMHKLQHNSKSRTRSLAALDRPIYLASSSSSIDVRARLRIRYRWRRH